MESQPRNPEFRINPEIFHPWDYINKVFHAKNVCQNSKQSRA